MKNLNIMLTSLLLTSVVSFANTAKVSKPSKKVYEVLEGKSMSLKCKPSIDAEISYKSEHVAVGEVSDVNISISTMLKSGILKVKLTDLEDSLEGLDTKNLAFTLSSTKENNFSINLKVSSAVEGIHYVNVVLSVEGEGSRVVAIPVNIGDISNTLQQKAVKTTDKGVVMTISNAQEEIK